MSQHLEYAIMRPGFAIILGRGDCQDKNVIIPDEIDGNIVYAIQACAFANDDKIQTLTIANTVTHLGTEAFKNCKNLTEVIVCEETFAVSRGIFSHCHNLTKVTLGHLRQLKWFEKEIFYDCPKITNINIYRG